MVLDMTSEENHLRQYLRILYKHRWPSFTLYVVLVAAVTIGTLLQTPIYEGTATVLIDREPPRVVNIQEVQQLDTAALDYYQTQYEIIKSRSVIERTIENLGLTRRMPRLINAADRVQAMLGVVRVAPIRNTRLVR